MCGRRLRSLICKENKKGATYFQWDLRVQGYLEFTEFYLLPTGSIVKYI